MNNLWQTKCTVHTNRKYKYIQFATEIVICTFSLPHPLIVICTFSLPPKLKYMYVHLICPKICPYCYRCFLLAKSFRQHFLWHDSFDFLLYLKGQSNKLWAHSSFKKKTKPKNLQAYTYMYLFGWQLQCTQIICHNTTHLPKVVLLYREPQIQVNWIILHDPDQGVVVLRIL